MIVEGPTQMSITPRPENWRTSSFSSNGSDCVELATDGLTWGAVRDSKNPDGDLLTVDARPFRSLVQAVKGATTLH
jgi:hypothetical protein